MENFKRTLIKTLTYKITGTLLLAGLTYHILGIGLKTVAFIGMMDFVTKLVLYIAHERLWAHIKWGNGNGK